MTEASVLSGRGLQLLDPVGLQMQSLKQETAFRSALRVAHILTEVLWSGLHIYALQVHAFFA